MKRDKILYYENVKGSYPGSEAIGGIDYYPGRILAATRSQDSIILPENCQKVLDQIRSMYKANGLAITEKVVWSDCPTTEVDLGQYQDHWLLPFIMNEEVAIWSGETDWYEATVLADSKNWAISLFQAIGAACPETLCFGVGEKPDDFVGPYRFKPARGATNIQQSLLRDKADLLALPKELLAEAFQLQKPIAVVAEGSVQFLTNQLGVITKSTITGQYVGNDGHEGNYSTLTEISQTRSSIEPKVVSLILSEAIAIAEQLILAGMRGYFGIDFLIDAEGKHFFTEVNPRRTGASTPCYISIRLGARWWANKLVKTGLSSLAELDLSQAAPLYRPEIGEGIIISSPFVLEAGKAGVMVIAPPDRWAYWAKEASAWLESEKIVFKF